MNSTLFLDDNPERCKAFKSAVPFADVVNTTAECIGALQTEGEWNLVFLDHDLGGEVYVDSNREDTGMEVVRWIIKNEPIIRKIIIHTHNGPAAQTMVASLREAKYDVTYVPFATLIKKLEITND